MDAEWHYRGLYRSWDLAVETERGKQLERYPRCGIVSWRSNYRVVLMLMSWIRYLLNPYLVLPSLALSTSSFENTLILLAVLFACQSMMEFIVLQKPILIFVGTERPSQCLFALSVLVHLSLSSILVLLPVFLLLLSDPHSRLASPKPIAADLRKLLRLSAAFLLYFILLSLISTLIAGNLAWIPQTWGATWVLILLSCLIN